MPDVPERDYTVVSQRSRSAIDPATNQPQDGMQVAVEDFHTKTTFLQFIPDAVYGPDGADTLIRHRLQLVREVAALGEHKEPPPPPPHHHRR